MGMIMGTSLLEQSSLSFHCHIYCFISQSEVKFPCGIILVELLKFNIHKMCIYIENGLLPSFF
jgi:hypothetical protein